MNSQVMNNQVRPSAGLVERAKAGDDGAFDELVKNHERDVFRLALKVLGNYELALDASQETFLRAWRALPRFRGDSSISTWLHRITVNTSLSIRKRALRNKACDIEESAHLLESDSESPEAAGERVELSERLRRALAQLTPLQRQIVVMKDVEGYSHKEVASVQNISVGASKVRLHRARAALRDLVSRE